MWGLETSKPRERPLIQGRNIWEGVKEEAAFVRVGEAQMGVYGLVVAPMGAARPPPARIPRGGWMRDI